MAANRFTFSASGWEGVLGAYRDITQAADETAAAALRARRAVQGKSVKGLSLGAGVGPDAKRAGDAEVAVVRSTERAKIGEREKADRHVAAIRDRYFAAEQKRQDKEEAAERKRSQAVINTAKQRVREMGGVVKSVIGSGVALGVGLIGAATRDAFRLTELANRISISSRGAGEQVVDPNVLRKEFEQTAIGTPGIKAEDVAAAVQGFVGKTGRLDVARQQQGTFATVASATGGDIEDIAAAAADLFQKFDVTSISEMRDALSALAFQGKAGAFELKDAASQFGRLSAAAAGFNVGKGNTAVRTLGGLTQIARSATGGPEQAATAVEALFRQLRSESGNIEKKTGVKVFRDKGKTQTADIAQLLPSIIAGAKGNQVVLQDIFKDEAGRAVAPLVAAFNNARNGTTVGADGKPATEAEKTAAGLAAVNRMLNESINAQGGWNELTRDAAQAQSTSSAKLSAAWENLKSKASDELVPALAELVPKITPFVTVLGSAVTALTSFASALGKILDALPSSLRTSGDDELKSRAAAAKADISALQETATKRALTPAEAAQLTSAKDTVAEADKKSKFIEDFIGANTSKLKTRRDLEIDAENFYQAAHADPVAAQAQADAIARTTGGAPVPFLTTANQAQADIVGNLASGVTLQRLQASGGKSGTTDTAKSGTTNMEGVVAALREIAGAVKANAGNQPSTVPS